MSEEQMPISLEANEAIMAHYKYDMNNFKIKIDQEQYSNMAYITVSGRDVYIDFIKMPGIISDGILVATGIRVYMPIVSAQRLGEALLNTIQSVEVRKGIEPLHPIKDEQASKDD